MTPVLGMAQVLTLTLNPALDVATGVVLVVSGEKLRCTDPQYDAGGGGINVSRAVQALGGQSCALVALGGATGQRLAALLRASSVPFIALKSPGETRQSMTVTETSTGQQYRFLLPGPVWQEADQAQVLASLRAHAEQGGIAVISGSQPPGVPRDFAARLAACLPDMRLVLDTSGSALAQAVTYPIARLNEQRMDSDEAQSLHGTPLSTPEQTADFAQSLVRRGVAECVIVARGAEGNVLALASLRLFARPPVVQVVSAVGAGDSFVAGLVLAMARGEGWEAALLQATAAAAAAVMTPATDLCRAPDVAALLPLCQIARL